MQSGGKCRNLRRKIRPLSINRPSNSWIGEGPLRRQEPSILEGPAALPLRITQRVLYWPGVDIGTLGQMGLDADLETAQETQSPCIVVLWILGLCGSCPHNMIYPTSAVVPRHGLESQAFTGKPQQIWMVLMQIPWQLATMMCSLVQPIITDLYSIYYSWRSKDICHTTFECLKLGWPLRNRRRQASRSLGVLDGAETKVAPVKRAAPRFSAFFTVRQWGEYNHWNWW